MENYIYLAPEYYKDFICKADSCRHTCCSGWRIPVSKQEYNKLITMECSDDLNRRVQSTFVIPENVSDDCYRYISFNWLGNCPIQEKGLCNLYIEKGEDYIPLVCRLYPRSLKTVNGVNVACCSCSCEKVVEMLMEREDLSISELTIKEKPQLVYSVSEEDVSQLKLINNIMKDDASSLPENIARVCKIINAEEFEKDFNAFIDPVVSATQLLIRLSSQNDRLFEIASGIKQRYPDKCGQFEKDRQSFDSTHPEIMSFLARLINNSLIYECFPFVDKRADKTRVYKGLCCCYGLLRLICIYLTSLNCTKDELVDGISLLFHLIDHTSFYYNVSILADNTAIMLKI